MNQILLFLIDPFYHLYVKNAFIICVLLCCSIIPLGTFLVLRKMTLLGEAFSHGVFPGIVLSSFIFSDSIIFMIIIGILTGFINSLLSRYISVNSSLDEESAFAGCYMFFFAISMIFLSKANNKKILLLLFGSVFGVSDTVLQSVLIITVLTILILLIIIRPLIVIFFSEKFARLTFKNSEIYYYFFLILLSANIVIAFKIFGNLMSLGLMFLPVLIVRIWKFYIYLNIILSVIIGILSSYIGILLSYYYDIQISAAIILILGIFYFISFYSYIIFNKYKTCKNNKFRLN